MKSQTFHIRGCFTAKLRDCSSFSLDKMTWHFNCMFVMFLGCYLVYSHVLWSLGIGQLGLGQLWLNLDPSRLLALPFGLAFHHQLVLLSYHPILVLPYHSLKFVSFLRANRTKSASVGPRLLRGAL